MTVCKDTICICAYVQLEYKRDAKDHIPLPLTTYTTVKVKVKFTLEQAMKAQRGSRGINVLFNVVCTVHHVAMCR